MTGFIIVDAQDKIVSISRATLAALGYAPGDSRPSAWSEVVAEAAEALRAPGSLGRWAPVYLRRRGDDAAALPAQALMEAFSDGAASWWVAELSLEGSVPGSRDDLRSPIDPSSLNFLTTVSHELRVSLNGVIGFANLLSAGELNEGKRDIVEKLQSCNFLLKGLVNDILEFSRVVSSNLDLAPESVPLAAFTREVCSLFRDRATRKGLELKIECAASAERSVALPKLRVTQVLSNLISNAIKFTEAGWVAVSAAVEGDWVRFTVRDSGPGVAAADVDKVFRPFVQIGPERGNQEGSGLGLSISKMLAERMGGSLRLEHPEAGGSEFVFTLPLARGQTPLPSGSNGKGTKAATAASTPGANGQDAPPGAPDSIPKADKRVLVVEDNQLNADILSHFLRDYGVLYEVVDNGRRAVETYEDGKYDLILMDVMLPELNGYEATEQILARSRRKPAIPIIGVTAKVFRRDQLRCIESGMIDVVHKPVDFRLLRRVLDRYLLGKTADAVAEAAVAAPPAPPNNPLAVAGHFKAAALEAYIDRMRTSDSDRFGVVQSALRILDAEVAKLLGAIDAGRREEISLLAHSLKGALALLGSQNLLDLVKGLEAVSAQRDEALRLDHWARLVRQSYEEFKGAIADYIAGA